MKESRMLKITEDFAEKLSLELRLEIYSPTVLRFRQGGFTIQAGRFYDSVNWWSLVQSRLSIQ